MGWIPWPNYAFPFLQACFFPYFSDISPLGGGCADKGSFKLCSHSSAYNSYAIVPQWWKNKANLPLCKIYKFSSYVGQVFNNVSQLPRILMFSVSFMYNHFMHENSSTLRPIGMYFSHELACIAQTPTASGCIQFHRQHNASLEPDGSLKIGVYDFGCISHMGENVESYRMRKLKRPRNFFERKSGGWHPSWLGSTTRDIMIHEQS